MKLVTAIIQPHRLEEVKKAVMAEGVKGMTVSQVNGYGRQRGHTEVYRGAEYTVDLLPKVKIEVAVSKAMEKKTVEAIRAAANTGRIGDGKIFVYDLTGVLRIRTGETGDDAL